MHQPSRRTVLSGIAAVGLGGCLGLDEGSDDGSGSTPDEPEPTPTDSDSDPTPTATPIHSEYEQTEVTVVTSDGEERGTFTAAIADTDETRSLGLSDTESLPEDRGMLFVFESESDLTFVMREMDFPIDIIYADSEGVITRIHHARAPGPEEDGNNLRFPGRGQYVLEVNRDWTTERNVTEGDELEFELP